MNHKPRIMKSNRRPSNQRRIPPLKPGKKHEGESVTGSSDWSTLPVEILFVIVEKLEHFGDRLSLASVCKDWRIPVTPRPLPWVLTFAGEHVFFGTSRSVTITFKFHEICSNVNEPCHIRPYKRSVEIPTCGDRILAEPEREDAEWFRLYLTRDTRSDVLFVCPKIEESKLGWLVVSMSYSRFIDEKCYQLTGKTLFVYNPFSARFMSLPDIPQGTHTITFSGSDPTSPDCVFFLIVCKPKNLSIHTWSPGQEVWKERHANIGGDSRWNGLCSVTWLNGIFYWCSRAHMESFNPSNGERNKIAFPSQLDGMNRFVNWSKLYELNGEILFFVPEIDPTKRIKLFFKFNPFEGTWIRGDDFLNDRLLFLSDICPSSYSVSGYGNKSSCRVFRSSRLSNHDDAGMKKKTEVECLMMDCLAKTYVAINDSPAEWLAPPLNAFG